MSVEKVSLNSLRCLLFFFFAGVGCLLPFISLHLRSSGLSSDEVWLISYVSPLFATLGPITIGPLVDYFSRKRKNQVKKSAAKNDRNTYIRTVLSLTVLLSAVFYCMLLSVPTIQETKPHQPEASFVCNDHGASLVQEKCNELSCFEFPNKKAGVTSLKNCKYNCDFPSHYGHIESPGEDAELERRMPITSTSTKRTTQPASIRPEMDISNLDDFFGAEPNDDYDDGDFGSGEESEHNWAKNHRKRDLKSDTGIAIEESPHICHEKIRVKGSWMCFVATPNSAAFNVNIEFKQFHEDYRHCNYPLGGNFSCRIPRGIEKPNESCKVVCEVENIYSPDGILLQSQCGQILNDRNHTFWSYLALRSFGDFFFSASVSLMIGAVLIAAGDEAGREFILPSLSYGLFATIVGYLHSDDLSPLQLDNIPNFFLGIVGFGFFSIFALFVLIFATDLSIGPPDWWRTTRNVQIQNKGEFYTVLFVLVLLGMLWGPIYFHVPWHITKPVGLELYVGCAAAFGALLSVPLVWKAYKVVDYCGYSNLLIGAFTIYILRYTGLLFIDNPWVLSFIGAMEAITLCLMLFSAVFYIRHLVPKHLTFTSQSLAVAAHFCLGGGLGCVVSTLLTPSNVEMESALKNSSSVLDLDCESGCSENEFQTAYHLIYVVGSVASAVIAIIYFFLYHCCLKKRCWASSHKSDNNGVLPHESGENGLYTPLRIIHNGREARTEPTT